MRRPSGATRHHGNLTPGQRATPSRARRARRAGASASDHASPSGRARRSATCTPASAMPHGTMRSNADRSGSQLSAKPCIVTPRATRTPIAATLRSGPRARRPAPRRRCGPSTRTVGSPSSAQTSMSRSSSSTDVGDHVDRLRQPHDRVADELARAVPGDAAAPVDVDDRRAVGRPLPGRRCAGRRCRPARARAAGPSRGRRHRRRRGRAVGAARPRRRRRERSRGPVPAGPSRSGAPPEPRRGDVRLGEDAVRHRP